jgi:hypothetical protein
MYVKPFFGIFFKSAPFPGGKKYVRRPRKPHIDEFAHLRYGMHRSFSRKKRAEYSSLLISLPWRESLRKKEELPDDMDPYCPSSACPGSAV